MVHKASWMGRLPMTAWAVAAWLATSPAWAMNGVVVASGFDQPLQVTAPKGDSRLFVVEKGGLIHVIRHGKLRTFLDVSQRVNTGSEGGLLGLAFDPAFATNGRFYIDYLDTTGEHTRVDRYTVTPPDSDQADPSTRQSIINIRQEPYSNHKGGWIGFRPGDAKNLYIGLGDGGDAYDPHNNAQDGRNLLGKILRIDVSGSGEGYGIAPDNPFVSRKDVRPEVWALGMRNPYRASFDSQTGDFWIGDVGQDTREEIDFEAAGDPGGHNYGWRLREGKVRTPGGIGGSKKGMTQPLFDYPHPGNPGSLGECVIGGYVYRGPSIPKANGRYFFGDCVTDRAFAYAFGPNGKPTEKREVTADLLGGTGLVTLSSFGEDGQGRLYVVGLSGVVVAMCPDAAAATSRPLAAPGQRQVHIAGGDPCAAP